MLKIFHYRGEFYSNFEEVDQETRKICSWLNAPQFEFTERFIFLLDFTLRELFNNAVEHGNLMQTKKKVKYSVAFQNKVLQIKVSDEGKGVNVLQLEGLGEQLDSQAIRKRGLSSIMAIGFTVEYSRGTVCARLKVNETQFLDESEEK